jgi:low temperature requirement protein LtrA
MAATMSAGSASRDGAINPCRSRRRALTSDHDRRITDVLVTLSSSPTPRTECADGAQRETRRLLRTHEQADVRPIELFFDLVYVLAVTQLTHHLLENLTLRGAGETLLLTLAVWIAWIHTTWTTNYFDREARPVRLMLIGLMLASVIMSASIPGAFDDRGLAFAVALVVIQVGGTSYLLSTLGHRHQLSPVFERVAIWWSLIGLVWLAGGLASGNARIALWAVAVALDYLVMWVGFQLPRLGRSRTTDYTIAGSHMAHRNYLFIIVALGESILVTRRKLRGVARFG